MPWLEISRASRNWTRTRRDREAGLSPDRQGGGFKKQGNLLTKRRLVLGAVRILNIFRETFKGSPHHTHRLSLGCRLDNGSHVGQGRNDRTWYLSRAGRGEGPALVPRGQLPGQPEVTSSPTEAPTAASSQGLRTRFIHLGARRLLSNPFRKQIGTKRNVFLF